MPERIARIASVFLVALCLSFAASAQTPKMGPDQSPAIIAWTVRPSDTAAPLMPRLVAAGSPPPR